ncbi:DUF5979 domain-containing protein [Nocardioides sp. QY071]|uniref:DUF5979 domain-containing protein n=1 Tax=Nocardioides sp. QY071 TaxID=3044187 RepID=UPI00249B7125|nr:DUF5979 domain-containing protein [Nocardioides sp. QY071]WGY00992.1 DUF5979 domain-containing protein [Nocardioides sp. QY071]
MGEVRPVLGGIARSWGIGVLAGLMVMLGLTAVVPPVVAAPDSLQIDKTVDQAEPKPGQTFTYLIQVRCSEDDCLDTQIVDELPAELAGFPIQNVTFSPNAATVPRTVAWQPGGGSTPPATVVPGTSLTVDLDQVTDGPVGTGLQAGTTYTISVSLKVPDNYPPGRSPDIVNTARVSASNADTKQSSATVNIDAPITMGADVTKTWQPGTQPFEPGADSTIGVGIRNTGNVAVDRLTVQEPKAAPDGAATLDASNPFTITDFTGFGDVDLPAGCDTVRVDAYVRTAGAWSWVQGSDAPAGDPLALPSGVSNAAVGGIRITCLGELAPGASVRADLGLEQRATHRNDDGDLSTAEHRVDNVATGSAALSGQPTATDNASASYVVRPAIPTVEANKDISPGSITAGQDASATISGTNGAVPVTSLGLQDRDFFTEEITFGGFTAPLSWPADATEATVTYHLLAGGTETVVVTSGQTPADPSGPISGFDIEWTGPIQASESGGASFDIDTTEDATDGAAEVTLTNRVDADVRASNGLTDADNDSDTLRIVDPAITTSLTKTVRPSAAVEPGDSVISSLQANAVAHGDGALVHDIVVEDVVGAGSAEFWDAFDLVSIAPTQVPAGTVLTVEVQDTTGVWHSLVVHGPQAAASVLRLDAAATAAALGSLGLDSGDVQGIRFSFHNEAGFPSNTTVTPNIEFAARGDLRDGGAITPGPDRPTAYVNSATVESDGESAGDTPLHDGDGDTGTGTVVTDDGGPGDGVEIRKTWIDAAVDAQSGDRSTTHLDWNVGIGHTPVVITDGVDPATTPVAETVYDAFDLVRIEPVAASSTPYTSGWYLRYDTITRVSLYDGAGWTDVPAPGGSWLDANRGFKGYVLTDAQRASTVGVRITLAETAADTTARQAAQQPGAAFDPFAPDPGTGVGAGSTDRRFSLVWQVRDQARSDGAFVIEDRDYNTSDQGLVENDAEIAGTPSAGGPEVTDTDADTIQILDPDPGVAVAKAVTPTTQIHVPPVGTAPGDYPTATWTLTGHNGSTARASYVRLTDPAACTDTTLPACQSAADATGARANPFDLGADHLGDPSRPNPFQRFDLTGVAIEASSPAQVDLAASVVWLLRYDAATGDYTAEQTTAAAVNAGITDPGTVVGISVTLQPTNPATSGGTITQDNNLTMTLQTRLRPTLRSTGADQVLRAPDTLDVVNRVFAQSYDPVTSPGVATGDVADAKVVLTGGIVNIAPTKSVSPTLINEPSPDVPVTVTLGADQGTSPRSTLSPQRVVIEDQAGSPDFWNTFRFTGLGAVTLPAGADRVQVDVYDGAQWVLGTPAATAALPAGVANADVQGVRFTFTRADGKLLSATVPAPNWSATARFTVQLRETYRDSGESVEFTGTVPNTQTSWTTRPDGNDSERKDATARVELSHGTRELAVRKLTNDGNRLASVGDNVPFDLTVKNTGTGFLTLTELRDVLPPELLYTGTPAPEFTAAPAGTLSDDVTVTPESGGSVLRFTWPAGGAQMRPGEVFRIRLHLELQPGLGTGQTATNTMTARTEETLTACRNTVAGGPLTGDWGQDAHTCGTSDYVGTVTGPNLYTVKGVRGSLAGATQPGNPTAVCTPNLAATGGSYYRSPCVANSEVDGTDDWVLHSINAGTVNIDEMTVFDQLPVRGDRQLVSGGQRGSAYRPQLVADSLQVSAPAGTTRTVEVTTSAGVCVGTWTDLATQPVCQQNGESWSVADASTDWSKVTGIRVHLDFRTTTAGSLRAGQAVDVTFSTLNVLASDADPSGVERDVPGADLVAWNQHGIKFKYTGVTAFRQIAPNRVGVHLRTGSVEIRKDITGPAAGYAPDRVKVDVACEAGGVALDLGAGAELTLTRAGDWRAVVDGVPVSANGSSCTFTEQGAVGEFGETSRSGTPVTIPVTDVTGTATITNDYRYTGLSVTKRVQTEATGTAFGPFTFTLRCTSITGKDVTFDGSGTTELEFTLRDGETFTAPADTIPVGAACVVTETDRYFADHIVVTGGDVVDNGDGSATVTPGTEPAEVEVTNAYDAGTVTLEKKVDGDGAARWGTGTFTFQVRCTYRGQTPYHETVRLAAGGTRTIGPFAIGTSCSVSETGTGGATSTGLAPADGTVVVPAPDQQGGLSHVTVSATNTFRLTSLEVIKKVVGDTSAGGAKGPFRVALACTWLVDGQRVAFDVPGGATRQLTRGNGYRASYEELPSSAACTLTETKDGGATSTTMTANVAGLSSTSKKATIAVDLTPTTGPGQASVRVVNTFDAVAGEEVGHGGGPGGGLPNAGAPYRPWHVALGLLLLLAGLGALLRSRRQLG